jgi:hypothetical protein
MEGINLLFTVWDEAAKKFGPIFEAINVDVAERQYIQLVQTIPPRFRNEFKLMQIGSYSYITGEIEQNKKPFEIKVPSEYRDENINQLREVK